ncbi:MAG TPA: preprotein translocase subunit SecE [Candidatus Paceibacterota bacterium]|nr:preprotein translocase subunit SecE [Candidatus Paceibacterota bacterium]
MFDRIKRFFDEARHEFRHVNWPTQQEAIRLTGVVIGISLGLAVFLGACDYLFTYVIRTIVIKA